MDNYGTLRLTLVSILEQPGIFDAYKRGVVTLKKIGRNDAVDLTEPNQVLCIEGEKLGPVLAVLILLPKINLLGTLIELRELAAKKEEEVREKRMMKELENTDWEKIFFEGGK